MKGFTRENPLFSLCGLNCGLCQMYIGGHCPGCGGGDGNQSCAIARCSLERGGIAYCWQCEEYPCARYDGLDTYDSFVICRTRGRDVELARLQGVEAYMAGLKERMLALDALLAHYNDGRRKSFFTAAASLLPLADIRRVMAQLDCAPEDADTPPLKERAEFAARLLREAADLRGIDLRYQKKPAKKK